LIEFIITMPEQQMQIPPEIAQHLQYKNILQAHRYLTSTQVVRDSGGAIPRPLSSEMASGLLGSMIVESGSADLSQLDVVERGSGAGRGALQYTGWRRQAYDAARQRQLEVGGNPNELAWQLLYMAQEYAGYHDQNGNGNSLSGFTRAFEQPDRAITPEDASFMLTRDYLRPATGSEHYDRRATEARRVQDFIDQQKSIRQQEQSSNLFSGGDLI
jgi:hypothetical protein